MGGHGGLNILPQKRWNVYNFDNREKVRKDEEEAAKQEQIKQDQSRIRQSQLRLLQLRKSKNPNQISTENNNNNNNNNKTTNDVEKVDSKHIDLFQGIRIFDPIPKEEKKGKFWRESKKIKKEDVRVVGPEDEVYRVGYGVVGKGVKLPWYLENKKKTTEMNETDESERESERVCKKRKKKSLEELREERVKRERVEKERERALIVEKMRR